MCRDVRQQSRSFPRWNHGGLAWMERGLGLSWKRIQELTITISRK
jgi:hypothetical protein